MRKKITALFLAVVMAVTLLPTAFAAGNGYSDTQGHWGEDAIDRWSGYGVISGTGNGLFDPSAPLTRAQAAQIFANLLNLSATASVAQYTDVAVGSWYYDAIAKCVAAGILNGTGSNTMSPNTYVSREELFVMFARALGIQPQASAGVTFTDSASTASWAAGYVNALADMGVVGGSGDGTLAPKADIDRASVVALLDKAITAYGNTSGATVGSSSGIVLVVADNVTVMGSVETLVVAGGSAGISGSTVGTISVVGESASVSVGGSANVGQVSVTGANASVTVRGEATVSGVTIADTAQGAELTVSGDATVTAVDSAAQNVTISGDGTIEAATVSGDNTTVDTNGTDLTVSEGTTGVTENDRNVSAGDTVVTEPAEDTGSSGESTTPSRPTNPSRPSYDYYTVTFMLDENTVYDTQRVREGSTVTEPADPTKTNYTFGGWYAEGATGPYNFETPVTDDLTLTARWVGNPVTITMLEGYNDPITYPAEYGTTLSETVLNAVIENARPYEYVVAWYSDENNTPYDFDTVVTGDMTLYYGCNGKEYTVTFVIADAQPAAVTDVYGTPVTLPTSTDDAYTWTWYEDADFTTPVTILSMPGGGQTLYGQWTHKESGLKGHGTENDPFLIGTAEELVAVNKLTSSATSFVEHYVELTDDIDYTTTTDFITYFCGTLDGNGHSILMSDSSGNALIGWTVGNVTIRDLTIVQMDEVLAMLTVYANGGAEDQITYENITFTSGLPEGSNHVVCSYGASQFGMQTSGNVSFINCVNEVSYLVPSGSGDYAGVFIGNYISAGVPSMITFIDCVNRGTISGNQLGFFFGNSANASGGVTLVDSPDYVNQDPNHAAIYVSNCRNEGLMLATQACEPFLSLGTSTVNDTANTTLLVSGQFTGIENMQISKVDDMALTNGKNGALTITPSTDNEVTDYTVNYTVSTTYKDSEGNYMGSWYFSVTEEVAADSAGSASFDYVTQVMLDTAYDETVAEGSKYADLASQGAQYDDHGNEYIIVAASDGTKIAVLNSKQAAENYDPEAATIKCGATPNYTLVALNEFGQYIGSIKYTTAELTGTN